MICDDDSRIGGAGSCTSERLESHTRVGETVPHALYDVTCDDSPEELNRMSTHVAAQWFGENVRTMNASAYHLTLPAPEIACFDQTLVQSRPADVIEIQLNGRPGRHFTADSSKPFDLPTHGVTFILGQHIYTSMSAACSVVQEGSVSSISLFRE